MGDYAKKIADLQTQNDGDKLPFKKSKELFKDTYDIKESYDFKDTYDLDNILSNEDNSYTKTELDEVKTYYNEYILNKENLKREKFALWISIVAIVSVVTLSYIILSVGTTYSSKPIIYKADHKVDIIKQPDMVNTQKLISSTPTVKPNKVEPTVVNNYNFEQLNTGLFNLGYCLLICFATFFGIKGFNLLGKSFKIKSQIKKSKSLIKEFNNAVNNGNYIAISQEINEQLLMNNIIIERFNNNTNTIELMAITERLKDIGTVINKNILTDLHNEK